MQHHTDISASLKWYPVSLWKTCMSHCGTDRVTKDIWNEEKSLYLLSEAVEELKEKQDVIRGVARKKACVCECYR